MNPIIAGVREGRRLHFLNLMERHDGALELATTARRRRQGFLNRLAQCAEDGQVAMVWSGMDCDCVKYEGAVRMVEATVAAVEKAADDYYSWADGPCGYYLERPSVARRLRYESRDLALEAFEDGHPHVVYA